MLDRETGEMELVVLHSYSSPFSSPYQGFYINSSPSLACLLHLPPLVNCLFLSFIDKMDTSKAEGKRSLKEVVEDEEEEDDDDVVGFGDDDKKKKGKRVSSGAGGSSITCQVENCTADFSEAKKYHRRHKVCEFHAKAPVVRVAGLQQRFCQRCSRLETLISSSFVSIYISWFISNHLS